MAIEKKVFIQKLYSINYLIIYNGLRLEKKNCMFNQTERLKHINSSMVRARKR